MLRYDKSRPAISLGTHSHTDLYQVCLIPNTGVSWCVEHLPQSRRFVNYIMCLKHRIRNQGLSLADGANEALPPPPSTPLGPCQSSNLIASCSHTVCQCWQTHCIVVSVKEEAGTCSMAMTMDLNTIIEQMEMGEQDTALRALQTYNKEVNVRNNSACVVSYSFRSDLHVFIIYYYIYERWHTHTAHVKWFEVSKWPMMAATCNLAILHHKALSQGARMLLVSQNSNATCETPQEGFSLLNPRGFVKVEPSFNSLECSLLARRAVLLVRKAAETTNPQGNGIRLSDSQIVFYCPVQSFYTKAALRLGQIRSRVCYLTLSVHEHVVKEQKLHFQLMLHVLFEGMDYVLLLPVLLVPLIVPSAFKCFRWTSASRSTGKRSRTERYYRRTYWRLQPPFGPVLG